MLNYLFNFIRITFKEPNIEIDVFEDNQLINLEIYFTLKEGLQVSTLLKHISNENSKSQTNHAIYSSEFILAKTLVSSLGGYLNFKNCLENICLLQIKIPRNLVMQ
jgi:hypothetical protein